MWSDRKTLESDGRAREISLGGSVLWAPGGGELGSRKLILSNGADLILELYKQRQVHLSLVWKWTSQKICGPESFVGLALLQGWKFWEKNSHKICDKVWIYWQGREGQFLGVSGLSRLLMPQLIAPHPCVYGQHKLDLMGQKMEDMKVWGRNIGGRSGRHWSCELEGYIWLK